MKTGLALALNVLLRPNFLIYFILSMLYYRFSPIMQRIDLSTY